MLPRIPLRVSTAQGHHVPPVRTPPVVELGTENEYTCGSCGAVLLRANAGQIHNVLLQCAECESLNLADT